MKETVIRYGRQKVLISKYFSILNYLVTRLGARHLNSDRPQLAIFAFDHVSNTLNIEGLYEKDGLELIILFLKENNLIKGNVLDVGANIGNHSVFFSNYYQHVYAFEPNPITYKILELNSSFQATNITPYALGISNKSSSLPFHVPNKANLSSARLVTDTIKLADSNVFDIEVTTIDNLYDRSDMNIGLIKIDVEGHEFEVLEGSLMTIKKYSPIILFEQHSSDITNGSSKVIEMLRVNGYSFYVGEYTPYRSANLPVTRKILNSIRALLFGSEYRIQKTNTFTKRFYDLIIAVKE